MIALLASSLLARVAQIDPGAGPGMDINVGVGQGIAGGAVGAFLTTLVIGLIVVTVAPEYTERMMAAVVDNPVGSFVYGLVSLVALLLVTFVLVITIIGILVAIPLAIAAYLVWAVGSVIAYLAIADRVLGPSDSWLKPLLLGAAINGVLVITGIGGIIAFCIGAAGFGAVLSSWLG